MPERKQKINGVPIPFQSSVKDLKKMLNGNMVQFLVACIALGNKEELEALDILISLSNSSDWCKRRAVAEAVKYHIHGNRASKILNDMLLDTSEYVVRTACKSIAELGIEECHDRLIVLLKSKNSDTREAIVTCLASIWYDSDFEILLNVFRYDVSKKVRDKAAWVLSQKADKNNWEILLENLIDSNMPRHREWACKLIGLFGERRHIKILKKALEDKNGHVRKIALKTIEKMNER